MENTLNHMHSNMSGHKLLAIYLCPEEPDVFLVGNAFAWQADSFICLKTISPEGNYDGFMICNPAYIYRYEVDNCYLHELSSKASQPNTFPSIHSWNDFLAFAMQLRSAIQIVGRNGKMLARGTLCGYSEQTITLQRILKSGAYGKQCRFFLSNIAGIVCDTTGGNL